MRIGVKRTRHYDIRKKPQQPSAPWQEFIETKISI